MEKIYITYAKRTPIGNFGGTLSHVRVDDLLAFLIQDLKLNMTFNPEEIDDVIIGCANQAGEDNRNLSRMSLLLGGLPMSIPGTTINRLCGSSLDAVLDGVGRISSGLGDCFVVGGAENMTRAPYVLSKAKSPFDREQVMYDTSLGWRFPNPKMKEMFPLLSMGETAEEVAQKFQISRERQDLFALQSHQKAVLAQKEGYLKKEILPVSVSIKKETVVLAQDEGPRENTTLEKLGQLRPVFRSGGTVTAGNSSSLNDGASLILLVSEKFLLRHKLAPLVRVTGGGVSGLHPNLMGLGPISATQTLCRRYQKKISDFDIIELNEAFSAQALACIDQLDLDPKKINLRGGSIAFGHPLGCSGTRILTTLIHLMQDRPQDKQGLATMCIGLGQGIALSVENCRS